MQTAGISPRKQKAIETTDIMQMVATGRGRFARWLAEEYAMKMPLVALRLGEHGIAKHIHLGVREADIDIDYVAASYALARNHGQVNAR